MPTRSWTASRTVARDKATPVLGRTPPRPLIARLGGRELALLALGVSVLISLLLTIDVLSSASGRIRSRFEPGDIVDQSYKAPADLTLVDYAATEEQRRRAMEQAPVVYDFDERWGQALRERVDGAFAAARAAARPEEGAQPNERAIWRCAYAAATTTRWESWPTRSTG